MKLHPSHLNRGRGFTLIESLLVVSLCGLLMSVAAISLSATDDAMTLQRSIHMWADLDARTRLESRETGAVRLVVTGTDPFTVARLSGSPVVWPSEIWMSVQRDDANVDHIRFDAFGRTHDYQVHVRLDERIARMTYAGATGAVRVSKDNEQ